LRVTVVYDERTGAVRYFRRDDVIDPFFRGWCMLTPTDDVMRTWGWA
jgi:hypothetical protein